MIQVSPQTRILVAVEAVDFRNGIDGLARVCQEQLQADPFSGRLFVFRNRRRTALKILAYDGRGFWLCQKRLSRGRFGFWPVSLTGVTKALEAHEFYVLLAGGDPASAPAAPVWRCRMHFFRARSWLILCFKWPAHHLDEGLLFLKARCQTEVSDRQLCPPSG